MYCPDLDDAVIPINYVTTFVLDINKTKPEEEQLEHMTPSSKVKQIWKVVDELKSKYGQSSHFKSRNPP